MRRSLAWLAWGALLAPSLAAQSLDQVIARHLRARGGLERIRAVETLRLAGRLSLPDVEVPLVIELKRPNRMRTEFAYQGRTAVRAYDGQRAWAILPVPALDEPRLMPPDEASEARQQADIDLSPLVDHAAKRYQVELVGREPLEGGEALKLVVRSPEGAPRTIYLDAKSYLIVRSEEKRLLDGREQDFVTELDDYRRVGGLMFAFRVELGPRTGGERQRIAFEKIEVNVPLDDARFVMPEAAPGAR